jgi:hypothetical protein
LGPRFLYASLVPAVLLSAAGIAELDRRLGRWRPALRLALLAGLAYAAAVYLPGRTGVIAGLEPEMKLHPEAQVERAGATGDIVFVKVGWGSRLIGRLWGWGVPAHETERAFRAVDGCRIQHALDEADSLAAAGRPEDDVRARLVGRLQAWRAAGPPVAEDLLPDGSVRVDTTRGLSERCRREAARDAGGYTLYETLVWRNDPWLRNGTIFARDLGPELNERLVRRFPGRSYYLYAPPSGERGVRPVLRPLSRWRPGDALPPDPGPRSVSR